MLGPEQRINLNGGNTHLEPAGNKKAPRGNGTLRQAAVQLSMLTSSWVIIDLPCWFLRLYHLGIMHMHPLCRRLLWENGPMS